MEVDIQNFQTFVATLFVTAKICCTAMRWIQLSNKKKLTPATGNKNETPNSTAEGKTSGAKGYLV